jgi:hypothetical protein
MDIADPKKTIPKTFLIGKACEVDLNSGTNFGYWCTANPPEGAPTFFSPWSAVKSRLGI